jgi:hypothetical protein
MPAVPLMNKQSGLLTALLTGIPVAAVYLPLALFRYAWSDDVPSLAYDAGSKPFADLRPIAGVLERVAFSFMDGIGSLWILRSLSVFGIVLFAVTTQVLLRRWGFSTQLGILGGISVAFLPPFHGFVGFAVTWLAPYLFLLGGVAGLLVVEPPMRRGRWPSVAGLFLLILIFLTYPPSAMCAWGFLGVRAAVIRTSPSQLMRESLRLGVAVAVAGITALGVALIVRSTMSVDTDMRVRLIGSLGELLDKLIWFVSHPVVVAARTYQISSPGFVEAALTGGVVLLLIAVGLFLRFAGRRRDRFGAVCLLFALASLTMSFHLIVPDNQIEYRFMTGLSVTIWLYLVVALLSIRDQVLKLVPPQKSQALQQVVSGTGIAAFTFLCVVTAHLAWTNVHQVFIEPWRIKETYLTQQLARFADGRYDEILIINPEYGAWPHRSNIGIYSTRSDLSHSWVAIPNVRLLIEEHSPDMASIPIVESKTARLVPPSVFVLDLRPLVAKM